MTARRIESYPGEPTSDLLRGLDGEDKAARRREMMSPFTSFSLPS